MDGGVDEGVLPDLIRESFHYAPKTVFSNTSTLKS